MIAKRYVVTNVAAMNAPLSLQSTTAPLIDTYGRQVTYLRVSVTDRCDFRCTYCMAENMKFLPRRDVLSFEEINIIVAAFTRRGVRKVRLTGGEPLVRRDIMDLIETLSGHLRSNAIDELTLTTNGSQLTRFASQLADTGVKRINVSLDTLDAERFTAITRRGRLEQVMAGIDAAEAAGLAIKINMVPMRDVNDDEIEDMLKWTHGRGFGLTLIEAMPMGEIEMDRISAHLPITEVRDRLKESFSLQRLSKRTGGPARYFSVGETGGELGFITPMSHNFCESCNRVRLTCTGELFMCLGQDDKVNLRQALRDGGLDGLNAAMDQAMVLKPKGHDFNLERSTPSVARHMSVTGG